MNSQRIEQPIHNEEDTMESNSLNPAATATADAGENPDTSSRLEERGPLEPSRPGVVGEPGQDAQDGDGEASMRKATEDADSFGRSAADATQGYLQEAKAKANATLVAGKGYAREAVNAAGEKFGSMKDQAADLKHRGLQFAADEPMKAIAFAAAGSAVLTAVLLTWMRGRR